LLDRAAAWVARERLYERMPRSSGGQPRPRAVTIRFGKYRGKCLDEVPPDALGNLLKFEGLWPQTRRAIEDHLAALRREASAAVLAFGKHRGEALGDLPAAYLDWLHVSYDGAGPVLADLVARAYRARLRKTRVRWGEAWETAWGVIDVELEREE